MEIYLVLDGQRLPIAQVGPDSFVLSEPYEIPAATNATIVIEIDGREERHSVVLYAGASKDDLEPIKFF